MSSCDNMQVEKSPEQRRQDAENDLISLSRVSHRLAMVDTTDKLSQVLDKLLPRLLQRIGDNHQLQLVESWDVRARIHAKLVEMLSHTMKRVREDTKCQIPCLGILELLVEPQFTTKPNVDPFTMNLSLAFLTLGLSRCQELEPLLSGLMVLHGHFSVVEPEKLLHSPSTKAQWHQVTHLLFRAMDFIMKSEDMSFKKNHSSLVSTSKRLKSNSSEEQDSTMTQDPLISVRALLAQDEVAASAFYDFLLDLLLYQTVPATSSVPPPGMSQAAHDRLKGGASETARDWGAEMAPRSQLVQMKCRCLDWFAPSRRWGVFMNTTLGRTRTMALLIAAAGDPTPEVSQRAATYLKQHLDSQREESYGDPGILIQELLILCVGASNAQLVLSKQQSEVPTLGIHHKVPATNQQAALSLKRRMVSETTFATMVEHVSKILQDVPQIVSKSVSTIGSLAALACDKTLSQLRTLSGMSLLQGRQYVSAAQLLNSLVARIATKTVDDSAPMLLAKSMAIACNCLSTVVSSNGTSSINSSGSEGNTSVRDALYGVICSLSRSNLPTEKMTWLFAKGDPVSSILSIETATLLFGCIAAEEETLRPRAVAALDALLGAYCRIINQNDTKEDEKDTINGAVQPVVDNPWGEQTSSTDTVMKGDVDNKIKTMPKLELSRLLLPLLWNAAQHSQPKQSRVAASRWASDLLSLLDLVSASHILCCLAGDSDVTAATIARDALNLGNTTKADEASPPRVPADFAQCIGVLFADNHAASNNLSSRPNYWEFTPQGRASAVEYLLQCLLHDIYGGDDDAIQTFVSAISASILDAANQARREYLGLLDICAEALSLCLSTSSLARSLVVSQNTPLTTITIQQLSLGCNSSKARRLLAESWCHLYLDTLLWDNNVWSETVEGSLRSCCEIIEGKTSSVGNKHGAAFLGGACIKVIRRHPTLSASQSMASLASR